MLTSRHGEDEVVQCAVVVRIVRGDAYDAVIKVPAEAGWQMLQRIGAFVQVEVRGEIIKVSCVSGLALIEGEIARLYVPLGGVGLPSQLEIVFVDDVGFEVHLAGVGLEGIIFRIYGDVCGEAGGRL